MRIFKTCAFGLLGLLAAPAAWGQDAPTTTIFGTYYRCTQGQEERADALFNEHMAPLFKAEVAAGRLSAYGWGHHWLGGDWRRLEYISGPDLDKLLDARDAVIAKLQTAEHAKAMAEFDTICSSHDDYIWSAVATSQNATEVGRVRTAVGASTYYVCDSRESEADAIMKSAMAPVLNQHVKEGKIASWSWLRHRMGGKYRRALVIDSSDHKAAVNYWGTLVGALQKEQPDMFGRFGEICSSHTDYVWDMNPAAK